MTADVGNPDFLRADVLIREFVSWGYESRGWAPSTCRQYRAVLHRAARYMGGIDALVHATPEQVQAWLSSHPRNIDTRMHARAILVSWYRYMRTTGRREDDPTLDIRPLRRKRPVPRALGADGAQAVIAAMDELPDEKARVLVALMMWAGLRVNEARHVRWEDISTEGWLHVTRESAKGGYDRMVPVHDDLRAILARWEPLCPSPEWVAPSAMYPGRPVSYTWIYGQVRELGQAAGIERLHPHKLRGTFATGLLETGTDVRVIAEALGHANLQTTMRYTRTRPALVAEAVGRLRF